MHFKSTKHPKFPETSKVVRAETIISGYILEGVIDDTGAIATKITIISQNDIKGVVPKSVINMIAGKGPKTWI